jgi:phage shock protein A
MANDPDAARIRSDIEQTREELGDTVQALATELDPRTQAARKAADARDRARTRWERVRQALQDDPRPAIAAGALLLLLMLRRRR